MSEEKSETSGYPDTYCGLLLAIFAAILALTDLGAGKFGDDEMIAVNEKSAAFMWYQSKSIGKENWVQTIDGKKGQVTGAEEWEAIAEKLGNAGDYFDGATLFLQLSLVLGAISLISPTGKSKKNFLVAMVVMGILGATISGYAFYTAFS